MHHEALFDDPEHAERGRLQRHGESLTMSEHLRCQYRGRTCHAKRATKLDGSLHKMCDVHRQRANRNQRHSQTRKREKERESDGLFSSISAPISIQPSIFPHESVASVVDSLYRSLSNTTKAFFEELFCDLLWREPAGPEDIPDDWEVVDPPVMTPLEEWELTSWLEGSEEEQTSDELAASWTPHHLPVVSIDVQEEQLHNSMERIHELAATLAVTGDDDLQFTMDV